MPITIAIPPSHASTRPPTRSLSGCRADEADCCTSAGGRISADADGGIAAVSDEELSERSAGRLVPRTAPGALSVARRDDSRAVSVAVDSRRPSRL